MPTNRWTLSVLSVFALMTASCAASHPISAVAPPRLSLPTEVSRPCDLPTLPENPDRADLDAAYAARGAEILVCDQARRLAVETLEAERRLIDAWLKAGTGR